MCDRPVVIIKGTSYDLTDEELDDITERLEAGSVKIREVTKHPIGQPEKEVGCLVWLPTRRVYGMVSPSLQDYLLNRKKEDTQRHE